MLRAIHGLVALAALGAALGSYSQSHSPNQRESHRLGSGATLIIEGLPNAKSDAPAAPLPHRLGASEPAGRNFFVDSQTGDDRHDGQSEQAQAQAQTDAQAPGRGPWRSLARVLRSDLGPGDRLQLACGSQWPETLRLPASGTPARPIVVSVPAAGCAQRPVIEGAVWIAPSAWTPHEGDVWRTALAAAPRQLFGARPGDFVQAHHPNGSRNEPGSRTGEWLAMPADAPTLTVADRLVSQSLRTGPELNLPPHVRLQEGARVRVRSNSYAIEEAAIASATPGLLGLHTPTTYPLHAGWGYLLLGQPWMIDSPGEWAYQAAAQQLYAQMPHGGPPTQPVAASVLAVGIDLQGMAHVVVQGLAVRRAGVGVQMRKSQRVTLRDLLIEDSADHGVDAAGSVQATVQASHIVRAGWDGITGVGHAAADATGLRVQNNVLQDCGVIVGADERVLSLPRRSLAAIALGRNGRATGNTVVQAGYIGIHSGAGGWIQNNLVYGACTVLDDCAGIYTGGAGNRSQIVGNIVLHSRGAPGGKPHAGTQAQGIYIDDFADDVRVQHNTVVHADAGVHLHNTLRTTVQNNLLVGHRVAQLWMQEDSRRRVPSGDMKANEVLANPMMPLQPGAVAVLLQTRFASTSGFARFEGNRYDERVCAVVAQEGQRRFTLAQWRRSSGVGSSQAIEAGQPISSAVESERYSHYSISGGNVVPNGDLAQALAGWATWNALAPAARLTQAACPVGPCLQWVAGGSASVLSSPRFALRKGQWYRLTVDVNAQADGQTVPLLVRRAGGDYASLADRNLAFTTGRGWARTSMVFQATDSAGEAPAGPGSTAARVDIDGLPPGQTLAVANLELVPIAPDATAGLTTVWVNASARPLAVACPHAATLAAACKATTPWPDGAGQGPAVHWPLTLAPRSVRVLQTRPRTLPDQDGDGIPDAQDRCPFTPPIQATPARPAGAAVNAAGCALGER